MRENEERWKELCAQAAKWTSPVLVYFLMVTQCA